MPKVILKMQPVIEHHWQVSLKEAKAIQLQLATKVKLKPLAVDISRICAVDVSYGRFDKTGYGVLGWFEVIRDLATKKYICRNPQIYTAIISIDFPYIPGYLSFREIPVLLPLFAKLPSKPDLLLVDGAGIAHPRGIGLAAHLGVIFEVPAIGCAKSRLFGKYEDPANEWGAVTALTDNEKTIGYVLRSKKNSRPLFISPGHLINPQSSAEIIRSFCGKYRIPEPLRIVDLTSKILRKNPQQFTLISKTVNNS